MCVCNINLKIEIDSVATVNKHNENNKNANTATTAATTKGVVLWW